MVQLAAGAATSSRIVRADPSRLADQPHLRGANEVLRFHRADGVQRRGGTQGIGSALRGRCATSAARGYATSRVKLRLVRNPRSTSSSTTAKEHKDTSRSTSRLGGARRRSSVIVSGSSTGAGNGAAGGYGNRSLATACVIARKQSLITAGSGQVRTRITMASVCGKRAAFGRTAHARRTRGRVDDTCRSVAASVRRGRELVETLFSRKAFNCN